MIKAFDLLGLGTDALRLVPVDGDCRLQVDRLAPIDCRPRHGPPPFAVIATAGSANTGAIDDLDSITDFCRGTTCGCTSTAAFGGLAVLTPEFGPQLAAIAKPIRSPSISTNGCMSRTTQVASWSAMPVPIATRLRSGPVTWRATPRDWRPAIPGFATSVPSFPVDFGRSSLVQPQGLWRRAVRRTDRSQLRKPGSWPPSSSRAMNWSCWRRWRHIVCFRFATAGLSNETLDSLNTRIVAELQVSGTAVTSTAGLAAKWRLARRSPTTGRRRTIRRFWSQQFCRADARMQTTRRITSDPSHAPPRRSCLSYRGLAPGEEPPRGRTSRRSAEPVVHRWVALHRMDHPPGEVRHAVSDAFRPPWAGQTAVGRVSCRLASIRSASTRRLCSCQPGR